MAAAKAAKRSTSRAAPPPFRPLQLATLVDKAPEGDAWLHEIKYDGYRLLLAVGGGQARAYTRSGLDWSDKFSSIIASAAKLPIQSALIDGEAVVLDQSGRSSFQLMQGAFRSKTAKVIFYAFDILALNGEDVTKLPLIERKRRLANAIGNKKTGAIRYSEHVIGQGDQAFKAACKEGLEGIISKRASAPYTGARSESWLKVKCLKRQEFIIAGWTASDKARGFRSLILAVHDKGKLRYAGKVGTGFTIAEINQLLKHMKPIARSAPPIVAPRASAKGARWIEPVLVAEIAFTEMTSDGILRHPSYLGLREDKAAGDVVVEHAKALNSARRKSRRRKKPQH